VISNSFGEPVAMVKNFNNEVAMVDNNGWVLRGFGVDC
jgi:hypothetical protein